MMINEKYETQALYLIYNVPENTTCVGMGVLQLCTICQQVHTKNIQFEKTSLDDSLY
jgi:hypothetical protein